MDGFELLVFFARQRGDIQFDGLVLAGRVVVYYCWLDYHIHVRVWIFCLVCYGSVEFAICGGLGDICDAACVLGEGAFPFSAFGGLSP